MSVIIAHRGASGYTPENTFAAFNKALELGSRFIEFDVMLSSDGEAFVFHDETLKRTTNGRGNFCEVNSEYLKSLDAGRWFSRKFREEKIPTLQDVLDWLIQNQVKANIEIKASPDMTEKTTLKVLSLLNRYWPPMLEWPLLSSFNIEALRLCRTIAPEIPIGLLIHEWQEDWLKLAKDVNCISIHLNRKILTASRVEAIKEQGYLIYAYVVNRKRQAKKLLSFGVDAVFSDYPDLML